MQTYQWASGSHVKAKAEDAAAVFEGIVKRDGKLSPAAIVADSRDAGAVLHECFEWNDQAAAGAYREDQARYMVRHLVVIYQEDEDSEPVTTRQYVSVNRVIPSPEPEELRSYVPVQEVLRNREMRSAYLATILREIESFQRRYSSVEEVSDLLAAMETTADRLRARTSKAVTDIKAGRPPVLLATSAQGA